MYIKIILGQDAKIPHCITLYLKKTVKPKRHCPRNTEKEKLHLALQQEKLPSRDV